MEIIKGFLRKDIFQLIIHSFIYLVSFVFADIIIFWGYQLNSFVGVILIVLAVVYLYIIMDIVLKLLVMVDKKIWKSLLNYGLLPKEKYKITAIIDSTIIIFSLPISVMLTNFIINYFMKQNSMFWYTDFLCVLIEVSVFFIAYVRQNFFISYMFEDRHIEHTIKIFENTPLFLKNVMRNREKMKIVICIICTGVIVCNGILFILNCDNSQAYIDKAISVDYFLTEHNTRSDENRTEGDVVKESHIEYVEKNEFFQAGGRIYHSLDGNRATLITDKLPELSKFSSYLNYPFETNYMGNYFVNLYGADDFVFSIMEIYEGEIDYEKLASGKYIIYGLERNPGNMAYMGAVSDEWKYFNVGDKVELEGENGTKEYEIMAICVVNHTYAEEHSFTYPGHELVFYLPTREYLMFGNDSPMRYVFCTKNSQSIDSELMNMGFESRNGWYEEYLTEKQNIRNCAIVFAFGCVGIGFFIFINVLIISYLDRKNEFEVLEKIGMTSKQIKAMVLGEGLTYGIIISLIIMFFSILIELVGKFVLVGESWNFVWTLNPMAIFIILVLIVSMLVPVNVYRCMDK